MTGKRIGVFGLGRSGLAVAKAATKRGASVTVYDQAQRANLAKPELADEVENTGAKVVFGWDGQVSHIDILVSNPAVRKDHPTLLEALEQGVEVWSEIEFGYQICSAPIVAITGTNGKSTTTVMTFLCLQSCGEAPILCGNVFGTGYPERTFTEAADSAERDNILVAEISSFQLEWIQKFKPTSAGITNITPDHLDRYEGFHEYAETKRRIFQNMGRGDLAVVPRNHSEVAAPANVKTAFFGCLGDLAYYDAENLYLFGSSCNLRDLPIYGKHNLDNACQSALLVYGVLRTKKSSDEIAKGCFEAFRSFKGLAHRMEILGSRNQVLVINNSMCTNPAAVVSSTASLPGKVHLLMGGLNKNLDFTPLEGYLANSSHSVYLFGKNGNELNQMLGGNRQVFSTMNQAFEAASQQAMSGETIMLAPGCASSDQFKDFRDRGDVFKAIAMEWLRDEPLV